MGWNPTLNKSCELTLIGAVFLIAAFGIRPYAGSWNDASRLATVEAIVDNGTLAIDDSIFVKPPTDGPSPFHPDEVHLREHGTKDKLFIGGRFYSDKSPVPAILMAGAYQMWRWVGGSSVRERPDLFCAFITSSSAGLSYAFAVWGIGRLAAQLGLGIHVRLLLAGSFALSTVALPYTQHVNNHILLTAVVIGAMLCLQNLQPRQWKFLVLGLWVGLGYSIDLGLGPMLLVTTLGYITWQYRCIKGTLLFLIGVVPFVVLHHTVNYMIGGTIAPANSVVEYLMWPGSPFNADNATGSWNHSPLKFPVYALSMLFGKRGFVSHNIPLIFLVPGIWMLMKRPIAEKRLVIFIICWITGGWLLYAALSNNSSGACLSIRWFVPFLGPAYYLCALCLRERPDWKWTFIILSVGGVILASIMSWYGPWIKHMVPLFWPIVGGTVVLSLVYSYKSSRRSVDTIPPPYRLTSNRSEFGIMNEERGNM